MDGYGIVTALYLYEHFRLGIVGLFGGHQIRTLPIVDDDETDDFLVVGLRRKLVLDLSGNLH